MKKYTVNISRPALDDINDLFHYIAVSLHEPAVAAGIKDEILKCIDSLEVFPLRNKLIEDEPYRSKQIRMTLVKNYYVVYYVKEDEVVIMRVIYARRDWKNIF